MPLFVCTNPECRTIDNTATVAGAWSHIYGDKKPVCSACEGEWHGLFEQRKHNGQPLSRAWIDGEWTPNA